MEYAIVDIETTGGYAAGSGITEIAVRIHDGLDVIDRFETLLDPGLPIPVYITALTGISDELVNGMPTFAEVAVKLRQILSGRVFVAHNVNFDYSFVKHHFKEAGYDYDAPKLCTVRLSRKLAPGLPSYSLGKLCRSLDIPLENQHRAGGDADATSVLFSKLLEWDTEGQIQAMLKRVSKDHALPPNVPKADYEALPRCPGVYYFKDQTGKVIYVGKARDIKKRVSSHFTGHNPNPQRQHFLRSIFSIGHESCGTELMALLLEAVEIKKIWPVYNRALKRYEPKFGLYTYEDQQGYFRLVVDKHKKQVYSNYTFNRQLDGVNLLHRLVREHGLCLKLCSLMHGCANCAVHPRGGNCSGACTGDISPAAYNVRVKAALQNLRQQLPTFAILDAGRHEDEQSCLWMENGSFYGMGYIDRYTDLSEPAEVKKLLTPYPSNSYIVNLLLDYAEKHPAKLIKLSSESGLVRH